MSKHSVNWSQIIKCLKSKNSLTSESFLKSHVPHINKDSHKAMIWPNKNTDVSYCINLLSKLLLILFHDWLFDDDLIWSINKANYFWFNVSFHSHVTCEWTWKKYVRTINFTGPSHIRRFYFHFHKSRTFTLLQMSVFVCSWLLIAI